MLFGDLEFLGYCLEGARRARARVLISKRDLLITGHIGLNSKGLRVLRDTTSFYALLPRCHTLLYYVGFMNGYNRGACRGRVARKNNLVLVALLLQRPFRGPLKCRLGRLLQCQELEWSYMEFRVSVAVATHP